MNKHKNARLSLARRIEFVQDTTLRGHSACQARREATDGSEWPGRYLSQGETGL